MAAKQKKSGTRLAEPVWQVLNEDSPFAVQEAYKALRTNVTFSLPGVGAKCVGVTSATKGEGKSSTVLNLAISYAQIGKRVLLVDCDMRLPTIAAKLGIKGRPGLSDVLVGEGKIDAAIRQIPNLGISVLPSGSIPPDATSLLETSQMSTVLSVLKKYYDYIFVDLPPVNTVTDAAILSRQLDGFLLVVRHETAEYREISAMLSQLRLAKAKVLGFVYNDAPVSQKKYYKNYYSHDNK